MSLGTRFASRLFAASFVAFATAPALAGTGQPTDWQINMQGAVTPIAEQIHDFNFFINIIMAAVVLLVLVLLAICALRFNEKRNPVPSRTTHHTLLEVVWSVLPVLILVVIAIPSFRLLYAQYDMPKADLTLKITGVQWYWKVEYQTAALPAETASQPGVPATEGAGGPQPEAGAAPAPEAQTAPSATPPVSAGGAAPQRSPGDPVEPGKQVAPGPTATPAGDAEAAAPSPDAAQEPGTPDFEMEVRLKPKQDLAKDEPYLLAVDNVAVVPVGKVVRVQVTAADVIHAFAMPSFGVKTDAVPGRLNETWFRADREGIYYGQCSELCGRDHAFMPLAIRVVSEAEYQAWLVQARQQFAANPVPYAVADAAPALDR